MDTFKSFKSSSDRSISPPSPPSDAPLTDHDDNLDQLADDQPRSPPDMATMATLVAHHPPSLAAGGVNKRYRPAPAKTFQCRGYGECRMVFSRSEHLARHIRKHTGERPFTCHCGKQFSRLDNLRQHAQTVHADKQDQNERMMRDLTSLHATMAAANKATHPRGKRSNPTVGGSTNGSSPGSTQNNGTSDHVKQEDPSHPLHSFQRPGTSTGYEGDHNGIIYQGTTWHVQTSNMDRPTSRPTNNHSFRDPGQSFLAPPPSNAPSHQSQSQSFLAFPTTFNFGLSDAARDGRPGSSSSRPPTAGGPDSHARTLPPLSAVVSASISSQPPVQSSFPIAPTSTQLVLPLPGSTAATATTHAFGRRPSTATRPGTAPATYFTPKHAYIGGPGMAPRPELSILAYGRGGDMAVGGPGSGYDGEHPTSPSAGYDSPFSFHPPALADSLSAAAATSHPHNHTNNSPPPPINPRKRQFSGADGPDDGSRESNGEYYDYGSESRPQSRRLSLMELCNDTDADSGIGKFLSSLQSAGGDGVGTNSRPSTSSGLVTSTSGLAIVDRSSHSSPPLLPRATQAAGNAVAATSGGGSVASATTASSSSSSGGGSPELGGGRVPSTFRRGVSSTATAASTAAASAAAVLRGTFTSPPLSASSSPRSSPRSPFSPPSRSAIGALQSASPASATDPTVPRRGGEQHDQVRISVSPHSSTIVGMRV